MLAKKKDEFTSRGPRNGTNTIRNISLIFFVIISLIAGFVGHDTRYTLAKDTKEIKEEVKAIQEKHIQFIEDIASIKQSNINTEKNIERILDEIKDINK